MEAQKIAKECAGYDGFSASLEWLEKLLNFFCQVTLVDSVEKLVNIILFIHCECLEIGYHNSNIFAFTETAVWLDPVGKHCVNVRGSKDVKVLNFVYKKVHITVMLCACVNGS